MHLPEDRKPFPPSRIAPHVSEAMSRRGGNPRSSHHFSTVGEVHERGTLNVTNFKEFFGVAFWKTTSTLQLKTPEIIQGYQFYAGNGERKIHSTLHTSNVFFVTPASP